MVLNDKTSTIPSTDKRFPAVCAAVKEGDLEKVRAALVLEKSTSFVTQAGRVVINGWELPQVLQTRVSSMLGRGEDVSALERFCLRLMKNPSWRSVEQLFPFLQHAGVPITKDGCFLAYKGVNKNYTDKHSGLFDNSPGRAHAMPRNRISDDPDVACHVGFHVGALAYAKDFASGGGRLVVCKVDPMNVVCVPKDASQQKIRVCSYRVVGNYADQLPSTILEEDWLEADDLGDVAEDTTVMVGTPREKNHKYDTMSADELFAQRPRDLQSYAVNQLMVVGLSRLALSKADLVEIILSNR